jgi:hypothetical protein
MNFYTAFCICILLFILDEKEETNTHNKKVKRSTFKYLI